MDLGWFNYNLISKNKLANRSVLIDRNGFIKTYYDKIHMYDVKLSKRKYFESKTLVWKKLKIINYHGVNWDCLSVMI